MNKEMTVFLDLDGVLVDWLDGMRENMNLPITLYDEFRKDPTTYSEDRVESLFGGREKMMEALKNRPPNFWFNLKFFTWARPLILNLTYNFNNVAFLTSPSTSPNAAHDKIKWQQTYFPHIPMVVCRHKGVVAADNKVLIDDSVRQCNNFKQAGGYIKIWTNQFEMENKTSAQRNKVIEDTVSIIKSIQKLIEKD